MIREGCFVSLVSLTILFLSMSVFCQSDDSGNWDIAEWNTLTSMNSGFKIDLPGEAKQNKKFNPGKDDETQYFRCTKSLESTYKIKESFSPYRTFHIGVFALGSCKRKPTDLAKESAAWVKLYSADDPGETILVNEERRVDGHRARFFKTVNSSKGYVWDLFVETDTRIYWMYVVTPNDGDAQRSLVERIFASFKLDG